MKNAIVKSRPDWAALNEKWARSGLPQKEFCRRQGVSYQMFLKQRRRYTNGTHPTSAGFADFIPVCVEPPRVSPEVIVELPMGVVIRFRGVQPS